jgi:hypothetical protein
LRLARLDVSRTNAYEYLHIEVITVSASWSTLHSSKDVSSILVDGTIALSLSAVRHHHHHHYLSRAKKQLLYFKGGGKKRPIHSVSSSSGSNGLT